MDEQLELFHPCVRCGYLQCDCGAERREECRLCEACFEALSMEGDDTEVYDVFLETNYPPRRESHDPDE